MAQATRVPANYLASGSAAPPISLSACHLCFFRSGWTLIPDPQKQRECVPGLGWPGRTKGDGQAGKHGSSRTALGLCAGRLGIKGVSEALVKVPGAIGQLQERNGYEAFQVVSYCRVGVERRQRESIMRLSYTLPTE